MVKRLQKERLKDGKFTRIKAEKSRIGKGDLSSREPADVR